jgi:hypothetical protein
MLVTHRYEALSIAKRINHDGPFSLKGERPGDPDRQQVRSCLHVLYPKRTAAESAAA